MEGWRDGGMEGWRSARWFLQGMGRTPRPGFSSVRFGGSVEPTRFA